MISRYSIYKGSILYIVAPILFFFLGWLRLSAGLILSLLLLLATSRFLKSVYDRTRNDESIHLTKEYFISFIILFLFLLSTGNTGFIGSWGVDIPWRNAIYQDLISQSWPVIYDYSHSMLCYYMVFWLVPAEISSLLHLNEVGSNIILFLWMYVGFILIFLLLCDVIAPKTEFIISTIVFFLFFSGINTFGLLLKSIIFEPTPLISDLPGRISWCFSDFRINGVYTALLIRSIYLCVADVYNQFFAIAISTLLFLKLRNNIEFHAFIGLLVLPYSPLGFVGIFMIEMWEFSVNILKQKDIKTVVCQFTNFWSQTNILAIISLIPIFCSYFFMNANAEVLVPSHYSNNASILSTVINRFNLAQLILLFFYYCFYFLI